jgi:hypothetical protein
MLVSPKPCRVSPGTKSRFHPADGQRLSMYTAAQGDTEVLGKVIAVIRGYERKF